MESPSVFSGNEPQSRSATSQLQNYNTAKGACKPFFEAFPPFVPAFPAFGFEKKSVSINFIVKAARCI